MKRLGLVSLCAGVLLLTGCGTLLGRASKEYTVSLDQEFLTIAQGESGVLGVGIDVATGVDFGGAEAEIRLLEPPEGVTASPDPLIIPAEGRPRTLTISVATDAPRLSEEIVIVEAVKGGLARTAAFKLSTD